MMLLSLPLMMRTGVLRVLQSLAQVGAVVWRREKTILATGATVRTAMDDSELNAIRSARLAELQKNSGQAPADALRDPLRDAKSAMLAQVLEPSARERLSRVRIVRPERADAVELYIAKLASTGAISRRLAERDVVDILDGLSRDEKKKHLTRIVFERKGAEEEDDDDFFD